MSKKQDYPFELDEITDIKIILEVGDKHYSLIPNKQKCEDADVDPVAFRIVLGKAALTLHDIVIPSLEEIKSKNLINDSKNSNKSS